MGDPPSSNPYAAPQAEIHPLEAEYRRPKLLSVLFSFQGRIPRRLYWAANIGTFAVAFPIVFALIIVFGEGSEIANLGTIVIQLPLLWISFALEAKRWHDRGKSAAWLLIRLIPLVGAIWALVELGCLRGDHGPNRYGPDPT